MNVPTITMPKADAKARLKMYRANLHRQVEGEYQSVVKALGAMAKGQALIDIGQVFRDCPFDAAGLPRLAICRADAREVELERPPKSMLGTYIANERHLLFPRRGPRPARVRLSVQFSQVGFSSWSYYYAQVPMIPADVIPAKGERKEWHILWEVDHWATKSKRGFSSRDPLLLKHVEGSLYAILAEWDLTPLERAIADAAFRNS